MTTNRRYISGAVHPRANKLAGHDRVIRAGIAPDVSRGGSIDAKMPRRQQPAGHDEGRSGCYRKRMTMGQLTTMPVEPNLAPPGPVSQPWRTNSSSWNSSMRRDR